MAHGNLERPLSRIVALDPSVRPFGAPPVEDRNILPFQRGIWSDPCRGSWLWTFPEGHLERPLSRIAALDPCGAPCGKTPVEDPGLGAWSNTCLCRMADLGLPAWSVPCRGYSPERGVANNSCWCRTTIRRYTKACHNTASRRLCRGLLYTASNKIKDG